MPHPDLMPAVIEAQQALLLNQKQLGELVGSSQRTVQRWYAGRGGPSPAEVAKLAAAVHPRDADVARRLAATTGHTLESLGVVAPRAPEPSPFTPLLVESVISAAADALDMSPRLARPAVLAALERAKTAGLTVDDLLTVLRPPAPGKRARS